MPNKPERVEKLIWPSECAQRIGCQVGMVSAVKKRLGIVRKKVFPSEIYGFLKENPGFTMGEVYPRKA